MNKLPYILSLILLLTTVFGNAPAAKAQERRPWSPQAKGAVIGGLGGAAAGAIIHKRNRPVGGVVGGVAGAGVGYAIGKHTDNKRKERARVAAANAAAAREARYSYAARQAAREDNRRTSVSTRTRTSSAPVNGLVAGTALAGSAYMAQDAAAQQPLMTNPAYLPNDKYGDPSHPYATSEYRRKSW